MDTTASSGAADEGSWRERAVERSLRTARAKAMSRSDRFIQTATQILSETGRTDFTVQELVERSKTSLRSFYQHFGSKDELMLALFEEIVAVSAAQWRTEVEALDDEVAGMRLLLDKIYGRTGRDVGAGINRALTAYHLQLAESRATDYARVLTPFRDVILDLVRRGATKGVFRTDIEPEVLAVITMQTLVGAAQMRALGAELIGGRLDAESLWQFCLGGLTGTTETVTEPAGLRRRRRTAR
jgi:AcrR family transcriptional regulator